MGRRIKETEAAAAAAAATAAAAEQRHEATRATAEEAQAEMVRLVGEVTLLPLVLCPGPDVACLRLGLIWHLGAGDCAVHRFASNRARH